MGAFVSGFVTGVGNRAMKAKDDFENEERNRRQTMWNVWAQTVPKQVQARRARNQAIVDTANTIVATDPRFAKNPKTALLGAAGIQTGRFKDASDFISSIKNFEELPDDVIAENLDSIINAGTGLTAIRGADGSITFGLADNTLEPANIPANAPEQRGSGFGFLTGKSNVNPGALASEFQRQTGIDPIGASDTSTVLSGLPLSAGGTTFSTPEERQAAERQLNVITNVAANALTTIGNPEERQKLIEAMGTADFNTISNALRAMPTPKELEDREIAKSSRELAIRIAATSDVDPDKFGDFIDTLSDPDSSPAQIASAGNMLSFASKEQETETKRNLAALQARFGNLGRPLGMLAMLEDPLIRATMDDATADALKTSATALWKQDVDARLRASDPLIYMMMSDPSKLASLPGGEELAKVIEKNPELAESLQNSAAVSQKNTGTGELVAGGGAAIPSAATEPAAAPFPSIAIPGEASTSQTISTTSDPLSLPQDDGSVSLTQERDVTTVGDVASAVGGAVGSAVDSIFGTPGAVNRNSVVTRNLNLNGLPSQDKEVLMAALDGGDLETLQNTSPINVIAGINEMRSARFTNTKEGRFKQNEVREKTNEVIRNLRFTPSDLQHVNDELLHSERVKFGQMVDGAIKEYETKEEAVAELEPFQLYKLDGKIYTVSPIDK